MITSLEGMSPNKAIIWQQFSFWIEHRHTGRDCRYPEAMDGNPPLASV